MAGKSKKWIKPKAEKPTAAEEKLPPVAAATKRTGAMRRAAMYGDK